jgi:hypothetical protein
MENCQEHGLEKINETFFERNALLDCQVRELARASDRSVVAARKARRSLHQQASEREWLFSFFVFLF